MQMFSVLLHNVMSFHCIYHILNSICIYLHSVDFQIHVSSSFTVEDLSTNYMTCFVLLTSLSGVSLQVASRADSILQQHPSVWILNFCRSEVCWFLFWFGFFCWGWRGRGKEVFSDGSVCSSFSCMVPLKALPVVQRRTYHSGLISCSSYVDNRWKRIFKTSTSSSIMGCWHF